MEICSNSSHQKGEITFYYQDQHLWNGLSASLLSGPFLLGAYEGTLIVLCKREKPRKNDAMPATRPHDFLTQNTKIFLTFVII